MFQPITREEPIKIMSGESAMLTGSSILTHQGFNKFLMNLNIDRDQAGERYERMRRKLIVFFEKKNCEAPDYYADETLDRVSRKINAGALIPDVEMFCYGVARMLILESFRKSRQRQKAMENLKYSLRTSSDTGERELHLIYLEQAMHKLSVKDRELLLAYYQGERRDKIENRKRLAAEAGIPVKALRIRVCRIRARVQETFFSIFEQHGSTP